MRNDKNHKRYLLIGVLMYLQCLMPTMAQDGKIYHFGIAEGLPSLAVYDTHQDSKGYMWFATDAGVCRFNGYDFELYDQSKGLTDNLVLKIAEDSKGRIWFGTFNRKLCYYENGSIQEYPYNDSLQQYMHSNYGMKSFYIDTLDNIWIGIWLDGICKMNASGHFSQMIESDDSIRYSYQLKKVENCILLGVLKNSDSSSESVAFRYNSPLDNYQFRGSEELDLDFFFEYKKNAYGIARGQFFRFESNNRFKIIRADFLKNVHINDVLVEGDILWLASSKRGVFKVKMNQDSLRLINQYFKADAISSIYRDASKGLWISSLGQGVYYMPNETIQHLHKHKLGVRAIEIDSIHGHLYLSWDDGLVSVSTAANNFRDIDSIFHFNTPSASLNYNYQHQYIDLGGVNNRNNYFYDGTGASKNRNIPPKFTKALLFDGDFSYRIGHRGLSVEKDKAPIDDAYISNNFFWGTSILKTDSSILLGSKTGLLQLSMDTIRPLTDAKGYLQVSVSSLESYKDMVLVGTKSYGLILLKNDSIYDIINAENGLSSSLVRCLHVDASDQIWVGTNNGLTKLNYKGQANFECHNIGTVHGLVSKEIKGIASFENQLFVGTSYGLNVLHLQLTKNNQRHRVFITDFQVNFKDCPVQGAHQLYYFENNINIHFVGLGIENIGTLNYEYRLIGIDSTWISTQDRVLNFPLLPSNSYRFEVRAYNYDGVAGPVAFLAFVIHPPFWLQWWFFALVLAVLAFLVFVIIKNRERKINAKARLQTQIIDLELKTLRSQMNPQFIFNTLNTIQNAVNNLDIRFASDYISRFGKLIRLALESSKDSKVSLSTEIEMLRLYVYLESLRFPNKFSFRINIDSSIDEDLIEVPSMVIQPFVENAILHGLTPKIEDDLVLSLSFEMLDTNTLCCIVEDNGIGRAAAAIIKQKKQLKQHSKGLEITQQRLHLYFIETGNKFSFDIRDLMDKNNQPAGTRIEIIFAV